MMELLAREVKFSSLKKENRNSALQGVDTTGNSAAPHPLKEEVDTSANKPYNGMKAMGLVGPPKTTIPKVRKLILCGIEFLCTLPLTLAPLSDGEGPDNFPWPRCKASARGQSGEKGSRNWPGSCKEEEILSYQEYIPAVRSYPTAVRQRIYTSCSNSLPTQRLALNPL